MTAGSCASSKATSITETQYHRERAQHRPQRRQPRAVIACEPDHARPRRGLRPESAASALAIVLFCVFYVLYNAASEGLLRGRPDPERQRGFALAMVAMAQTVPVLAGGLDLSVGAVMTLVGCLASHLWSTARRAEIAASASVVCLAAGAARRLHQRLRRRLWPHPADHRDARHRRRSISASPCSCARRRAARSTRISTGR